MKVNIPDAGLIKILLKVTDWELPLVTLLLSGTDWAIILIPPLTLDIVKVPIDKPVTVLIDCMIAWFEEIIELTINTVLKFKEPPPALITAEPTVSLTDKEIISKDPPSDSNNPVDISGSFGSWLTLIVKSVKLSQSVLEIETKTVGLNGIQETAPVFPPTQFPQLSINAEPPKSPLQSKLLIVKEKVCKSTSPNSELIVDVKVKLEGTGLTNKSVIIIDWELPLVTLLLSGNDVEMIKNPVEVFSTVKDEYTCPEISSTDFIDILSAEIIKSTIKVVVTFIWPPAAMLVEVPTTSFVDNPVKSKLPPSEAKTAEDTSGSFGSWEKEKEKSDELLGFKLLKLIVTVGVKSIHGKFPVIPSTQFPQLSV